MLFKSDRCQYREFGIYQDGKSFAQKFPNLLRAVLTHNADYLLSDAYPGKEALSSAIQQLPEYLAFLKSTLCRDFHFAAFGKSEASAEDPAVKKTGQKDVQKFILEGIRQRYNIAKTSREFVVEAGGRIVGYAALYDAKPCETGGMECARRLFVAPQAQSEGYGKEIAIAITDYAFRTLKMKRAFTIVDPGNEKSINNIVRNSGALFIGEVESSYAHLKGQKRHLFHIYPQNFYQAVMEKGNQKYLVQKKAPVSKPAQQPAWLQSTHVAFPAVRQSRRTAR